MQQQQGMRRQTADVDAPALAENKRRLGCRKQIDMLQRKPAEALIVRLQNWSQILTEVNLVARQHRHRVAPGGLDQFHLDVRERSGVAVQEARQNAFNVL